MTKSAGGSGAQRTRCPRCGLPVLTQLVGHRAALSVTADDRLLKPAAAAAMTGPNRLAWCVRGSRWTGPQLRWIHGMHRVDCPHPHVIDHQCRGAPR